MDDIIFTAYNKNRGTTITLTEGFPDKFGKSHIIHRRPDMKGKINSIKHTIENTDIAYKDKNFENRERLYCLGADSQRSNMYMTVVVEYNAKVSGTVITAWPSLIIPDNIGDVTYVKSKR